KEKTLSEQLIKEIKEEGGEQQKKIEKKKIREILEDKVVENNEEQKKVKERIYEQIKDEGSLKKREAEELIEGARVSERTVFNENFEFEFNLFGYQFKKNDLTIRGFLFCSTFLILVLKSIFSLSHYY